MFEFAGAVTVSEPLPAVNAKGRKCWPTLKACVTAPKRISETEAICAAFGVCTVKTCPYESCAGAAVIVGLGPLKRYGGAKNSALNWSVPSTSGQPTESPPAEIMKRRA